MTSRGLPMKTLTSNQRAWLAAIPDTGVSWTALLDLHGNAKRYQMAYMRSVRSAIAAHNSGTAKNSPLPADVQIVEGPFGPKGGQGVRLAREALIEVAVMALASSSIAATSTRPSGPASSATRPARPASQPAASMPPSSAPPEPTDDQP